MMARIWAGDHFSCLNLLPMELYLRGVEAEVEFDIVLVPEE